MDGNQERQLTDIPFLIGVCFILMSIVNSFDLLWVTFVLPYDTFISQIMLLIQYAIITTVLLLMFTAMLGAWNAFKTRPKLLLGISGAWGTVMYLGFSLAVLAAYDMIGVLIVLFTLPTLSLMGVTFIIVHSRKGINFNGLWVGVGALINLIAHLLNGLVFAELGVVYVDIYTSTIFIGVFIECLAYSMFIVGFLKKVQIHPLLSYEKTKN